MKKITVSLFALSLLSCTNGPSFLSGGFGLIPPLKLQSLGVPLAAYVIVSTDPSTQHPLTLDPATNRFRGEISVTTGSSFDLTVVYTADDPVSGQTLQIAHYIRRGLVATGSSMTVAYEGDEANWETLFDLTVGSPNDLNLDGDQYNNFIEVGYGSDPTLATSLPEGPRANGTHKDPLFGDMDVSLPPPGSDIVSSLRGSDEVTIAAITPFDVRAIEIVSPTYGYELLSTDEELAQQKRIRIRLHTAQFVVGPEVGSMTLTVRVTDEYDIVRETTLTFAVYNLSGTCGNGVSEIGEGCDDGNQANGDGCSSTCQNEPPPPPPTPTFCGDGMVNGTEECDDGNSIDTDSCTNVCRQARCGDGVQLALVEECDDGNTAPGDGCNGSCRIEAPEIAVDSPDEGATVRDLVPVDATAVSRFGVSLQSLRVTDPVGVGDQNGLPEVLEGMWDTRLLPDDQEVELVFQAQDTGGRTTSQIRQVFLDNTPNLLSFITNTSLISSGGSVILSWQVTNVTSLSIDNGVGTLASSTGSQSVTPIQTATYTLTATRTNGLGTAPNSFTTTSQVMVRVNYPPTTPSLTSIASATVPEGVLFNWTGGNNPSDDSTCQANVYALEIQEIDGTPVASIAGLSGTSFAASSLTGDEALGPRTDYQWRITATDNCGGSTTSAWSSFTTGDDGLMGWWRFNEGSGTTAADSSGNGNDGALVNFSPAGWVAGISGNALQFDGVNDYLNLSDDVAALAPDSAEGFTVEAWIRPASLPPITGMIFATSSYWGATPGVILDLLSDGRLQASISDGSGNEIDARTETVLVPGGDYHVAMTFEGGLARLFLNGRMEGANSLPLSFTAGQFAVAAIGASLHAELADPRYFGGRIDEAALYNRALSVDEIRQSCRRNDPTDTTCPDPREPIILTPLPDQILPPTMAYWSWRGERDRQGNLVEPGLTYEVSSQIYVESVGAWTVPAPIADTSLGYHIQELGSALANLTHRIVVTATDPGSGNTYSSPRLFSTDNSVVGWWRLDGNALDSSGGGHNGSLLPALDPPVWVEDGVAGGALQLDGSENYVLIGDHASLESMGELTVEAWVRTTSGDTNRAIVAKWWSGSNSYTLRMSEPVAGRVNFSTLGDATVVTEGTTLVNDGNWHYLAGTYDGANQRLYIDLALEGTSPQTGVIANGTHPFCIGDFCAGGVGQGFGIDGTIDEVAVYTTALTSEQLKNHYCATLASSGMTPLPSPCVGD